MKSSITVEDILSRRHFENSKVIAGKEGLGRQVKWVHVVEVTNIRNLLNGNELILSTGVAWRDNKEKFISVIEQLIDSQAAGICIEIGTYTSSIPPEIIDIANKSHFPIILFLQEVPFVEITQDIHGLLINRQYQVISNLESYSQALNKRLLTIDHYVDILKFIRSYLHVQVIILFNNNESLFIPEATEQKRMNLLECIRSQSEDSTCVAKSTIHLLGERYAELVIITEDRELTEFDHLILDRTATALAQLFLRNLYVEEKQRVEATEWINDWLEGEQSQESINEYLALNSTSKPKGAVVCICKLDAIGEYTTSDLTYFKMFSRAIFEQRGFTLFVAEKRNNIVLIMLNERTTTTWKARVQEGIQRLLSSDIHRVKAKLHPVLGIGKFVEELTDVHKSYQTAFETIRIQNRMSVPAQSYFYDDLHIFRLISLLHRHIDLQEVVLEYLEPVIAYDKKYNGKLMETLKTYLSCNGSKQETAKRLFIVRQTLYHRIQKLEKLLGSDFMSHEKRLAIEFMILSYEFLVSSKQLKEKKEVL
ncbi:PucR family transcriptional regulator ligand-binding domain-containing protein [Fredinandcohnia sp. QZ13]|uniref:PucR family transcriptional regulator n=1 Tax=Fredinandcohnia sp. QZ13 TaxID=3073144 RepID=UPI00285334E1|nr:PucR family transcriptional regulator ligand-binding domain-containing protein [Fredinandcohnia sp. QZ13]MDR4886852.1 PucR family transcriptional regulator ligand-binding domain-containing protein [Fredinandcohnia sp. QZ13]